MAAINRLSFGDGLLSKRKKTSRMLKKLSEIDQIIDWQPIVELVRVIVKTDPEKGGRPHKDLLWMFKAIFLQHLFNLCDPELDDQLVDRLSF